MKINNLKYLFSLSDINRKNRRKAILILITGLIVSFVVAFYIHRQVSIQLKVEFTSICNEISNKISTRLHSHAQLLRTGSAFFAASDSVTRNDWKVFNKKSKIEKNLPGIQGLGYTVIIPKNELQQHIQSIRKQGFPDYTLKPEGDREIYTSIIYLEPFSGRNLKAFGYDMFSDKTRRTAMEKSRDEDIAMLTGKVVLVQESNKDVQIGTLMYVPVYCKGMPVNTIEQRRLAIKGWVYSPYRMNDLMQGILGRWDLLDKERIHLQIFDDSISTKSILLDSQKNDSINNNDATDLTIKIPIEFNGKKWILLFTKSNKAYNNTHLEVISFLAACVFISLLLYSLSLSLYTTRQRAQQIADKLTIEIKERQERFKILINSTAEAIYGLDMNGNCIFSNSACHKLLGYKSSEQLLGKNMHDLIHHTHEDGSTFEVNDCRIFKAFIEGKGTHVDDEVLWRADGTSFPAEYWSYPIFFNGIIEGAVVTFVDITKRKQVEEALQSKMAMLEAQKNATLDGILVIDNNLKRILINNRTIEIFNVPLYILEDENDAALLKYVVSLCKYPDDFLKKVMYLYEHDEEVSRDEIELINGIILDRYSAPVKGEDGKAFGRIWSFRDITESKQAITEINRARSEAEKANHAKSEFLSRMSHELRTPMNSILGFAQLMDMGVLETSHKKAVNHILNSGRHLLDLINEVLDISSIEAGKISLSLEAVQPKGIILELIDIVQPNLSKLNLTTTLIDSSDNQLFVKADIQRLKQVLLNLINNAVKYNTEKGNIVVSIEQKVKDNNGINWLRISISDNGKGISAENIEHLFLPFERMGAEKTETEGTGLGLTIVKKIMDAMGGKIGVYSTKDEGSTFWIELPQCESQFDVNKNLLNKSDQKLSIKQISSTILYIEDNKSNIELVEQILFNERPGIRLISNINGSETVNLALEYNPDLILLDINLPDINGAEVLELLQTNEKTSKIPVIIVSADAMPKQIQKLMDAGAKKYLTKPFEIEMLLKEIDECILNKGEK